MKIEALETFLDMRDRYEKGDIRTVSDEDGARFCKAGWAKDLANQVKTGPRQTNGRASLNVQSVSQKQTATKV